MKTLKGVCLLAAALLLPAFTMSPTSAQVGPGGGGGGGLEQPFITVDVSNVPGRHRGLFTTASRFWNQRLNGYTAAIPRALRETLVEQINITANVGGIDGAGGVLGFAAPTDVANLTTQAGPLAQPRDWAISQAGEMTFDVVDLDNENRESNLATVIHEMAHALGFGSLWQQNNLIGVSGNYDFEGFGLAMYRAESGLLRAPSIPVEQAGGGGSAGSHWDDGVFDTDGDGVFDLFEGNLFNQTYTDAFRADFMLAFALQPTPSGQFVQPEYFLTNTTWASFEDVGLSTGLFDEAIGGGGIIKWSGNNPPPIFFRPPVPEPGSMTILVGFGIAALARRKRA